MSAFNPAGLVTEYGQLDTLLTDGQTPGSHADDLFLNMLDQYDQATGSDGYFDHDGMVDELLDALNRRLNPIGLEASRSGVVLQRDGRSRPARGGRRGGGVHGTGLGPHHPKS